MQILSVNVGSSSVKAEIFDGSQQMKSLFKLKIEGIGMAESTISATGHYSYSESVTVPDHGQAILKLTHGVKVAGLMDDVKIVGHRVVFGGPNMIRHKIIDNWVLSELNSYVDLDPEHMPRIIESINILQNDFPQAVHVACMDTDFYAELPYVSRILPIPRSYSAKGVMKYGFHGLSYHYLLGKIKEIMPEYANRKIVIAHLGSGSSVTAIDEGKAIDTTMAISPVSGVPMSTRSGDLDPGVMLYMIQKENLSGPEISHILNKESGLKGISELTGDMYALLQAENTNPKAHDAVEAYVHGIKKAIGSMAAVLGGVDLLVFSGGVGERSAPLRQRICSGMIYAGIELDNMSNNASTERISTENSIPILVLKTNEEHSIAQTACLLAANI